ncbi:nucleolar protein 14 [Trichonephila clavata]|uniref:Nucleolar protein 14 n=1 Tax=Trichonephila clavata TaxID=2740835 RepID=A0A8X6JIY4_TRICU|nr:nucleolar protein 14 [Trichonephila clavata]
MVKQVFKKNKNFKGEGNPFNLKLNREKHTVLGKKPRGTKGLRCISRAQSHMKRKELYNKSKKIANKANNFVDRRLLDESAEDSITARLVKERKKRLKKNIFNLNEENLTHKGVPLHLAKDLDEVPGSDDDEQLDAAFVSKAHFGGFSAKDQENLSHKELIEQLILQSKEKKQEQKLEKEFTTDLTKQLNVEWKNFIHNVNTHKKEPLEVIEPIQTDKNKSLQASNKEESVQVTSKQEPMQITDKESMKIRNKEDTRRSEVQVINTVEQMPPDKQKQLSNESKAFDIYKNLLMFTMRSTPQVATKTAEELEKEKQKKQLKLETERRLRMADDKEMKAKSVNHLSVDSILDDFDLQPVTEDYPHDKKVIADEDSDYSDSDESMDSEMSDHMIEDNSYVKSMKNQSDTKSCYADESFSIPANMDEFEEFLEANKCVSSEEKLETIGKILKPCFNAKSETKLNKLATFFGILIEYGLKHFKNNPTISENIVPHLFDIIEVTSLKSSRKILSLLDQEQELFQKCPAKKKKKNFPKVEVVLLLKYCSVLYSVSDFIHPVITPAVLFMCDILASEFFINFQNIESRLCICSIILDCVTLSKRLVPEAVCFLNKLLKLTFPFKDESLKIATGSKINLIISEKQNCNDINYLKPDESSSFDSRKLSIILKSVNLLQKFAALYQYLPSFTHLFKETLINCAQLPIEYYPDILKNSVSQLVQEIKKNDNKLVPLTFPKVKPKPLELFEPSYESKFCKIDNVDKRLRILKNVQQKIKKENKDMVREMRRDVQVVASEKLKEELQSDAERKRKVKELYHDIACERGDYKKMLAAMK